MWYQVLAKTLLIASIFSLLQEVSSVKSKGGDAEGFDEREKVWKTHLEEEKSETIK